MSEDLSPIEYTAHGLKSEKQFGGAYFRGFTGDMGPDTVARWGGRVMNKYSDTPITRSKTKKLWLGAQQRVTF